MSSAGCACGKRGVRSRHMARGFARGLLFFSEKQTAVTVNVFLAVQRIPNPKRRAPLVRPSRPDPTVATDATVLRPAPNHIFT